MRRALFLDRDGIVNVEKNYVHQIKDFDFIPEIFEIIKLFQKQNFLIFIVTNQAGIERGYYTAEQFLNLTDWMLEQFSLKNILISKVYYCPHHPQTNCECRKPKPGMLLQAQKDFDLDLPQSYLIGDKDTDILSGLNAAVGHLLAVHQAPLEINTSNFRQFQNHSQLLKYLTQKVRIETIEARESK